MDEAEDEDDPNSVVSVPILISSQGVTTRSLTQIFSVKRRDGNVGSSQKSFTNRWIVQSNSSSSKVCVVTPSIGSIVKLSVLCGYCGAVPYEIVVISQHLIPASNGCSSSREQAKLVNGQIGLFPLPFTFLCVRRRSQETHEMMQEYHNYSTRITSKEGRIAHVWPLTTYNKQYPPRH